MASLTGVAGDSSGNNKDGGSGGEYRRRKRGGRKPREPKKSKKKRRNRSGGRRKSNPAQRFPPDLSETPAQTVARLFKSLNLRESFPASVNRQVDELCAGGKAGTDDPSLKDLTALPYITIDNDNSMDLDQAMHIEPLTAKEGYLVSYALADGAYFVTPGTPLFDHALARGGSSFYLPTKCIPMLPRKLSEDIMSLNEGVDRRALVFDMFLDIEGNVTDCQYCWAKIRSRWKGTYREAAEFYDAVDAGKTCAQHGKSYTRTLEMLREVGEKRRALARKRHVVEYHRTRAGVKVEDGRLCFAMESSYVSELYNEQISLLANSCGAELLDKMSSEGDHVQPIFRIQDAPDQEKVTILRQIISDMVASYRLDKAHWDWNIESGEPLSSYLSRVGKMVTDATVSAAQKGDYPADVEGFFEAVTRQAMITNVAASFENQPGKHGHFSLKMSHYSRFSSPMRELVGCFTHKEFSEGAAGKQTEGMSVADDTRTRNKVRKTALRAKRTQKRLTNGLHLVAMNHLFFPELNRPQRERTVYLGRIIGMDFSERRKSSRLYVRVKNPPLELKVFGEDMNHQYGTRYRATGPCYGRYGTTIEIAGDKAPSFRVGDRVAVSVRDHATFQNQPQRNRWIFGMRKVADM